MSDTDENLDDLPTSILTSDIFNKCKTDLDKYYDDQLEIESSVCETVSNFEQVINRRQHVQSCVENRKTIRAWNTRGYITPRTPDRELRSLQCHPGVNFENYWEYDMEIMANGGDDPPEPLGKGGWAELEIPEALLKNIVYSKMHRPTPIQRIACPVIKQRRDCLAIAETGQGKTAVYLVPIISNLLSNYHGMDFVCETAAPKAVILSPTRELAVQIATTARRLVIGTHLYNSISLIYGGASMDDQAASLENGCALLVATIGRLLDFVQRNLIDLSEIEYLVIDEAGKQLSGDNLSYFLNLEENQPVRKCVTVMTSATMSPETQHLAKEQLKYNFCYCLVGRLNQANLNIKQEILKVPAYQKFDMLVSLLNEENIKGGKTLVFVNQRRRCQTVAIQLALIFGTVVEVIHADRHQRERENSLEKFKKGLATILVSTNLISEGIDILNVETVINFDLPIKILQYNHRIGRTARIGHGGRAISFYDSVVDLAITRTLCKVLESSNQAIPEFLKDDALSEYNVNYLEAFDFASIPEEKPFYINQEW